MSDTPQSPQTLTHREGAIRRFLRATEIDPRLLGMVGALLLIWLGNPYPVAGPFGAVLAIGARAAYLASEALTETWRLTTRRLIGPGGRSIPLARLPEARPFFGSVQITTTTGDRHLIKYLADPAATASRIEARR